MGRELGYRRRADGGWEPEWGVELPGGHVAKPIAVRHEPENYEVYHGFGVVAKTVSVEWRPQLGDELAVRAASRRHDGDSVDLDLGCLKVEVAMEDVREAMKAWSNLATVRLVPARWWRDVAAGLEADAASYGWRGRTRSELNALHALDALVEETCALAR